MKNNSNKRIVFNLKKISCGRIHNFGYYLYNKAESNLKNHTHNNIIELCFCLKGEQMYKIKDTLYKLNGNDIIIIPPNTKHSSDVYPEDIGELYWLQVDLNETLGRLCFLPKAHSKVLLKKLTKKTEMVFKGAYKLKPLLNTLRQNLKKQNTTLNEIKINQTIIQILLNTLEFSKQKQAFTYDTRLKTIDQFITANNHKTIYVDELASLLNLSTAYFKHWFKQNMGTSPKVYINKKKIELAKTALKNNNNVTQVAFKLGFNSSQYFATIFKKHTGMTPKAYILKSKINNEY